MHPLVKTMLFTVTAITLYGTVYSVLHETYLDTSDPVLTHMPHPLHQTHYFASKRNFLNVYFTKRVWGYVSAAFLFLFFTSPSAVQTRKRVFQFFVETAVWLVFTGWFFGAPVLDRVIANTGGECLLTLPAGGYLTVPTDLCYTKATLSPATHPGLFAASVVIPAPSWTTKPRLRRGHDVSGHIFLLTMSTLFLADQLRHSFKRIPSPIAGGLASQIEWSSLHGWAVLANLVVIAASLFSIYTTSVYFHTPFEKVTGFLLGLAGFALTQMSSLADTPTKPNDTKTKSAKP